jgi:hypothetical protein
MQQDVSTATTLEVSHAEVPIGCWHIVHTGDLIIQVLVILSGCTLTLALHICELHKLIPNNQERQQCGLSRITWGVHMVRQDQYGVFTPEAFLI